MADLFIVFGDSLSDTGTYFKAVSQYQRGKFTTNPSKIWVELVAESYQLSAKPNRHDGFEQPVELLEGFNFAQSGANDILVLLTEVSQIEKTPKVIILDQQVQALVKKMTLSYNKISSEKLKDAAAIKVIDLYSFDTNLILIIKATVLKTSQPQLAS